MGNYSPTRKHNTLIGTFLVSLNINIFHTKFPNGCGACLWEQHILCLLLREFFEEGIWSYVLALDIYEKWVMFSHFVLTPILLKGVTTPVTQSQSRWLVSGYYAKIKQGHVLLTLQRNRLEQRMTSWWWSKMG